MANAIQMTPYSVSAIWNVLRNIKMELSFLKPCDEDDLYDDTMKHSQVSTFEKLLKINSSETVQENMSNETLKMAADMFFYLTACPHPLQHWYRFYADLFVNQPAYQIILTLNRMIKGKKTNENENFQSIAKKLFKRAESLLSLKFKGIQDITQGLQNFSTGNIQINSQKGILEIIPTFVTETNLYSFSRSSQCQPSCSYHLCWQQNISICLHTIL